MNDRQRDIIDAAVDQLMEHVQGLDREQLGVELYQLVIDCMQPPRLTVPEMLRRMPLAGEVLPPVQRATWAREKTAFDAD